MNVSSDRLPVFLRYAFRNLRRNARRTLLSVVGIAVGCTVALVNIGFVRGKIDMFLHSIAEGGVGHLRVVHADWLAGRDAALRVAGWERRLAALRADPTVLVATPRARVQGMLMMGTRLAGAEIVGVDPATEPAAFRYVRVLESGRYLKAGDRHSIVIGRTLADRLGAGVGDALVVSAASPTGSITNQMFDVVGIVNLGGKLDAGICQVALPDAAEMSGIPGAGEIAVILRDGSRVEAFRTRLRSALPPGVAAVTWAEISPQSWGAVRINEISQVLVAAILIVVTLLGVASSQLTAVLERRREFAVLAAIGMGRATIVKLLLSEAIALGMASLAATLALAGPIVYYFATVGIRILDKGGMSVAGIALVDPVFRANFGPWLLSDAALLTFTATLLASLYPGWFATRLDPAEALRVAA
jgi:putative ABC transport system permease protein